MKVIVIGAGLIGTLTSYYLAKAGLEVEVIDAQDGPAQGASFANGGQLSYTYHQPFGCPELFKQLPGLMRNRKVGPSFFSLRPDPALWEWYGRLLWHARGGETRRRQEALLTLHLYSRQQFAEFYQSLDDFHFNFTAKGKLHIFSDKEALAHAAEEARRIHSKETPQEVLSRDQCLEKEPSLTWAQDRIVGGIYSPVDVTGDAYAFTQALIQWMERHDYPVQFHYGTQVTGFIKDGEDIFRLKTSAGEHHGDAYVLAAGHQSLGLLQELNIHLPLQPIKGHSLTLPILRPEAIPKISVTAHEKHTVFSPMGRHLRVAGLTQFGAKDAKLEEDKIKLLLEYTQAYVGDAVDLTQPNGWAGMRPALPWSTPIISGTPYKNLFFNLGHGMFGWTQAHGSARLLADVMLRQTPEIGMQPFTLS